MLIFCGYSYIKRSCGEADIQGRVYDSTEKIGWPRDHTNQFKGTACFSTSEVLAR
jgi:hypothetical protein